MRFATVDQAVEAIRQGRMVIVVDDEDRENEGDLIMAAQFATPAAINFMIKEARGLICVPMPKKWADRLELRPMVEPPRDHHETAFTVSVDAREGITTGISAHDRARTIRLLADPRARPQDFVSPGHVFVPAGGPGRGGIAPGRPYRSSGGSMSPRGPGAGGGHLRDHERGRQHGSPAGP